MRTCCSSLIRCFGLALLLLAPAVGFAQDAAPIAPVMSAPSAAPVGLSAPPPERRWVLSAGPFNPIGGLVPNLRVELVVRPHLAVALEGAFRQTNYRSFSGTYPYRSTTSSLSAGVRYYFRSTAPKGFYVEVLVGGDYRHFRYGDQGRSLFWVQPEVGVGYQFLIGKRRRFVADLGGRVYGERLVHPKPLAALFPGFPVTLIPSARLGFAF